MASRARAVAVSVSVLALVTALGVGCCLRASQIQAIGYAQQSWPLQDFWSNSTVLQSAEHLLEDHLVGPESLVVDGMLGWMYMGLGNGRIVRLAAGADGKVETIARTGFSNSICDDWGGPADLNDLEGACGRPLGMRLTKRRFLVSHGDADEDVLVVCDAYSGLLMVSDLHLPGDMQATVTKLAMKTPGDASKYRFHLLNDVAVMNDGSIYFTETSTRWQRNRIFYAVMDGHSTGRLLRWNVEKGSVAVVLSNLLLPNGITPAHDGKSLLMVLNKTQVWSFDTKSRTLTLFADMFGTGDNIRTMDHTLSGKKQRCYWLGWGSKYANPFSLSKFLEPYPVARQLFAVLPYQLMLEAIPKQGLLAVYGDDGSLLEVHSDIDGTTPWLSEAEVFDGYVYLGSWFNPYLARLPLSAFKQSTT